MASDIKAGHVPTDVSIVVEDDSLMVLSESILLSKHVVVLRRVI